MDNNNRIYVGQLLITTQVNELFIIVKKKTISKSNNFWFTIYDVQRQQYAEYSESTIRQWFNNKLVEEIK